MVCRLLTQIFGAVVDLAFPDQIHFFAGVDLARAQLLFHIQREDRVAIDGVMVKMAHIHGDRLMKTLIQLGVAKLL